MKTPLSVVILAKNEEKQIGACLESVAWADEIIVIDSGSVDKTVEISQKMGAKVLFHSIDQGFSVNKNFGNREAKHEWILSLDCDERIPPELAKEIQIAVANPLNHVGFKIPRKNYFIGKWIRGAGWWPDWNIRLFKKEKAKWEKPIHEVLHIEGEIGALQSPIWHYSYESMEEYFQKFHLYTSFLAQEKWDENKRISFLNGGWYFCLNPLQVFLRKYFLMCGWKDGTRGLFISFSAALVVFTMALKIWGKQLEEKSKKYFVSF